MNERTFDLNLLIVFDAMIQERSVTRAGRRIGLSQPAMSHALNRLRYMLNDELFVRTSEGMVPTPRAAKLAQPLSIALSEMRLAMMPEKFDPATSVHRFRIAADNYSAIVLGPPLVAAVSKRAPALSLDIRPKGDSKFVDGLDRGDLDLAFGCVEGPSDRLCTAALLNDPWVLVMRRGHPVRRRKLSATVIAALSYADVSSCQRDTSFLDRWLFKQGLERRIALRVPNLSVWPILAGSDLVAIMTRRVALSFMRSGQLEMLDLPFDTPVEQTSMLWHSRLDNQPAHRWLRDVVLSVVKDFRGSR
jgi:DNA-binding transcriptional LysR family regulator